MFCLTCGASLAGTTFFSVCGSIFIFPCSGLNHMRFLSYLGYTLLGYAYFTCITLQNDLGLVQGMIWGMFQEIGSGIGSENGLGNCFGNRFGE